MSLEPWTDALMPSLWAAPHPSHSLWCGEPVGGCSFLRPLVPCWAGWSKLAALHPVGFPVWPFCLALPPSKRRPRDPSGSGASTVQCVCVYVCVCSAVNRVGKWKYIKSNPGGHCEYQLHVHDCVLFLQCNIYTLWHGSEGISAC